MARSHTFPYHFNSREVCLNISLSLMINQRKRACIYAKLCNNVTRFTAVKQRMQQFKSRYSSSMQCAQSMLGKEGMGSFYRAYGTQICMNVPQQCIHFASYEYFKRKLNPTNEYRSVIYVIF